MDGYDLARTFGLDGPPLPARFSPAETQVAPDAASSFDEAYPVTAAPPELAEPFYCLMTEEELREFEDLVTTLHVELPIEVVRPLARGRATQHPVRLCRWDAKRGRSPRRGV